MAHVVEDGKELVDEDMRKLIFGDYFNNSGAKVYSEIQVQSDPDLTPLDLTRTRFNG